MPYDRVEPFNSTNIVWQVRKQRSESKDDVERPATEVAVPVHGARAYGPTRRAKKVCLETGATITIIACSCTMHNRIENT